MELAHAINLNNSLLSCDCLFCHTLKLFSSFLLIVIPITITKRLPIIYSHLNVIILSREPAIVISS